mgnify:FL=1|jgi:hypothetical protein|tara:strand:+ start:643 stop:2748 length:2106 start_codon:yes stop_codon:yes gene_type:complete
MTKTPELYSDLPPLIKAALAVADTGLPVFPTVDKMPAWSNAELGVAKGDGGYKIASTDPERVIELFSHRRAKEIAVPMGEMSGLMCVDVDLQKGDHVHKWRDDNAAWLIETRCHSTRSGGLHFLFRHIPGVRFPAQLAPGVDIKAGGTGYICWPGTVGYSLLGDVPVAEFPIDQLKHEGERGPLSLTSWNSATDHELIDKIKSAADLYPALRSLSVRLPTRRGEDGLPLGRDKQVATMHAIMDDSEAAKPSHPRHEDWLDRRSRIEDLVDSAIGRGGVTLTPEDIARLTEGEPFMVDARPIGPQQETTASDIEELVGDNNEVEVMSAASLALEVLPPIEWLVDQMIPMGGTVSLGGTSNVGKTRWLAHLSICLAAGNTEAMGLPASVAASVLWCANEERVEDIKRRLKAASQHMGIRSGADIVVRGKTAGMLRLIALNEIGTPEIDRENVAKIVGWCRKHKAQVVILDPYVTLSDAMDENSATSAAMLTKAFLLISSLTGAAVIHAHHTPKDRNKDGDWYRADSGAWRGSGAIYSALDCGFTLANWMPPGGEARKRWKQKFLEDELGRFIVLDTGKIREGRPLVPVVYELVGEELPEGFEIGVCRVSSASEAENVLQHSGDDAYLAGELAYQICEEMGEGVHSIKEIHGRGVLGWPLTDGDVTAARYDRIRELFTDPVSSELGMIRVAKKGKAWALEVVLD